MKLRPYQEDARQALWQYWQREPGKFPVVVAPTAFGKTVLLSAVCRDVYTAAPACRILILAHRKELITQTEDKLLALWPAAPCGVYAASAKRKEVAHITIASRDSLRGKLKQLGKFGLVIIDEAHRVAPSEQSGYRKIIAELQGVNPSLMVVGLTATPYRQNNGLIYGPDSSTLFDGVAYKISVRELLKLGFLTPVISRPTDARGVPDLSSIKTTAGDFNLGELCVAHTHPVVEAAVNDWERIAVKQQGRKLTLFFCVSLRHAGLVTKELARRGYNCPLIHGGTPSAEREQALADANALRVDGLVNVGTLTEGTDIPPADCAALMRPCKSLALYVQMVGRIMRLAPDKKDALLLDYGECLARFGPVDAAEPPEAKGQAASRVKECEQCGVIVGQYARKCFACGFRFMPEPVRTCPICEHDNAPTASACAACDYVFVTHTSESAGGAVTSDQQGVRWFGVADAQLREVGGGYSPQLQAAFMSRCGLHVAFLSLYPQWPGIAREFGGDVYTQLKRSRPVRCLYDSSTPVREVRGLEFSDGTLILV